MIGITDFRRGFDYLVKKIEGGALDHAFITRHGSRVCVVVSPGRWRILNRYRKLMHELFAVARKEGIDIAALLARLEEQRPLKHDEALPLARVPACPRRASETADGTRGRVVRRLRWCDRRAARVNDERCQTPVTLFRCLYCGAVWEGDLPPLWEEERPSCCGAAGWLVHPLDAEGEPLAQ